ncbi:DUF3347 domain-containing protein [Chitinophaga sancti]|uniref:Copper chaperone CopZ n=1 Tax=Chitinophaga sancti TaxID=1004 RepID=A0A1K1R4X3_9BACT|nr:DUF3347 domain-containing protein [Chitinophaga sancti]WQD64262.1 DUF3347 domain-containing protein [Chitinophaga sancti]WQG90114.1 DUF3347 domain-containing protein [Chitinophaga sancti]SFW66969.1 Copper chaperone CopZ [Chitinophaga sancti]
MKSTAKLLMVIVVLLSSVNSFAQIKNAKTETIKIYGNCGMCKTTIEKAGNIKKVANVEWNKDTKMATLTYDIDKTSQDEILKRIALAGYDSEKFLAPDDVYAKLPGCCQYDRALKPVAKNKKADMDMGSGHGSHDHSKMASSEKAPAQSASQLTAVFDNYFSVKDALIKTDATNASDKAAALVKSVGIVDMSKLSAEEHTVWMKVMKNIAANAEGISKSKDISKQREAFATLSTNVYELARVSKQNASVYYQHCPMYNGGRGANWLSKENAVKNPYYGSQMLTCGSTVETLK